MPGRSCQKNAYWSRTNGRQLRSSGLDRLRPFAVSPLNPAEKAPVASLGHEYQGLSDLLLVRSIGNFGERGADPSACWRKRRSRCHDDNAAAADLRGRERRISRRPSATRPSDHSRLI